MTTIDPYSNISNHVPHQAKFIASRQVEKLRTMHFDNNQLLATHNKLHVWRKLHNCINLLQTTTPRHSIHEL